MTNLFVSIVLICLVLYLEKIDFMENVYIVLSCLIKQRSCLTLSILSRSEEPAKVGTCARDRRALQQLALNMHVKHSDLT